MNLLQQFQGIIGSFLFGFFGYIVFHFLKNVFMKKILINKIVITILYCALFTWIYFLFLIKYTFGIYNVFFPLSMLIGILAYSLFYYDKFEKQYNKLSVSFNSKLIKPIQLKMNGKFAIISKRISKGKKKTYEQEPKKEK